MNTVNRIQKQAFEKPHPALYSFRQDENTSENEAQDNDVSRHVRKKIV